MKKTYNVDSTHNNMRIDRWVRNNIGTIPQGLIEKNLRKGKIKLKKKKIKSSQKIKTNDQIDLFNFDFKNLIYIQLFGQHQVYLHFHRYLYQLHILDMNLE